MTRILVVDDSLSVRKALEKILQAHAEVSVASNAEDALSQLRASLDPPQLVISDILMPGMSGFDLTRELRQLPVTAKTPVVLISGIIDDEVQRLTQEVGAEAVVRKPFTAEDLLPVIRRALGEMPDAPALIEAGPGLNDDLDLNDDPELLSGPSLGTAGPAHGPAEPVQAASPEGTLPQADRAATGAQATVAALLTTPQIATNRSGTQALVETLSQKPGVLGVLVATSDGLPLETVGTLGLGPGDLAMYARFFAGTASTLGSRLQGGASAGMQLEFDQRTLLILPLGGTHLLICLLSDVNSANMVRFAVRRQRPPLPA